MIKTLLPDRWRMIILRRLVNNIKRKALEKILKKDNLLKSEFYKDSFKKTRFLKVQL